MASLPTLNSTSWALRFLDFSDLSTCHISLLSIPQIRSLQVRHLLLQDRHSGDSPSMSLTRYISTSHPRSTRPTRKSDGSRPPNVPLTRGLSTWDRECPVRVLLPES